MSSNTLRAAMLHAVTAYDRRQVGKRGHNPYALPQYFERIEEICADIDAGADPRAAIVAGFSGRLANAILKTCGLSRYTVDDATNGSGWAYEPVSQKPNP